MVPVAPIITGVSLAFTLLLLLLLLLLLMIRSELKLVLCIVYSVQ